MGVKNTYEQISNIDFTFEELSKFIGEIDFITKTINTLKKSTMATLRQGKTPDPTNFFAKSSYINITENTPEVIAENLKKVNAFTFSREDAHKPGRLRGRRDPLVCTVRLAAGAGA